MMRTAGLKYGHYTSKRPFTRRMFELKLHCATLGKLSGRNRKVGEKMPYAAQSDGHGQTFPDKREEAPRMVTKALRARKNAKKVKAECNAEIEATLREANEKLVVASVNAHMITEAAEKYSAHLSFMAEHDVLTGLPNRALLKDRLAQSILHAKRHGNKVALMFMDIDHFKHINDSLGHAIGDKLLQSIAKRLQAGLRNSDTVSRYGGDEFVALLTEVEDVQSVVHSAEKLIQSVGEPHLISGQELHVTLSIGISMYPDDGVDADVLMRNADIAMYQAKRTGRNSYEIFTPSMNSRSVMRKSAEQALERALTQSEFILHYQPTLHLETGVITGAEVFLRWERSDHRLNCPAQFITIAENCGVMLPIGQWVIREACRQAQAWLLLGLNLGQIAVNVSEVELIDNNFVSGIRAILSETRLDPRRLQIEMNENSLSRNSQQTLPALYALKDLGVQIAVDNFGTGRGSLSFLREFPIDTVKIDKSFVHNIGAKPGKAVFAVLMAMARGPLG